MLPPALLSVFTAPLCRSTYFLSEKCVLVLGALKALGVHDENPIHEAVVLCLGQTSALEVNRFCRVAKPPAD